MERATKFRVVYSFPYRVGWPGVGHTAWHQINGLIQQGCDVTVCCGSIHRPVPGARRVVESLRICGVRIPNRLLGHRVSLRYHDRMAARLLRRMRGESDIVHGWPGSSEMTLRTARELGIMGFREEPNTHAAHLCEVVTREHSRFGLPFPSNHAHRPDPRLLATQEREYELARWILVPSEYSRQTFLARGVDSSRLILHDYGYEPSDVSFSIEDVRVSGPQLVVAFVGTGEPRKGLHYALAAWERAGMAGNGRFLICGKFMPGYRRLLSQQLGSPGVEELGFVRDPMSVLRGCDALILASIEEGSALVTYEAQACGCALLVSDAAGARCRHLHNGLVHAAGDVDALASHMRLMADDPALRLRLRRAALDESRNLRWADAAVGLHGLYEQGKQELLRTPAICSMR